MDNRKRPHSSRDEVYMEVDDNGQTPSRRQRTTTSTTGTATVSTSSGGASANTLGDAGHFVPTSTGFAFIPRMSLPIPIPGVATHTPSGTTIISSTGMASLGNVVVTTAVSQVQIVTTTSTMSIGSGSGIATTSASASNVPGPGYFTPTTTTATSSGTPESISSASSKESLVPKHKDKKHTRAYRTASEGALGGQIARVPVTRTGTMPSLGRRSSSKPLIFVLPQENGEPKFYKVDPENIHIIRAMAEKLNVPEDVRRSSQSLPTASMSSITSEMITDSGEIIRKSMTDLADLMEEHPVKEKTTKDNKEKDSSGNAADVKQQGAASSDDKPSKASDEKDSKPSDQKRTASLTVAPPPAHSNRPSQSVAATPTENVDINVPLALTHGADVYEPLDLSMSEQNTSFTSCQEYQQLRRQFASLEQSPIENRGSLMDMMETLQSLIGQIQQRRPQPSTSTPSASSRSMDDPLDLTSSSPSNRSSRAQAVATSCGVDARRSENVDYLQLVDVEEGTSMSKKKKSDEGHSKSVAQADQSHVRHGNQTQDQSQSQATQRPEKSQIEVTSDEPAAKKTKTKKDEDDLDDYNDLYDL